MPAGLWVVSQQQQLKLATGLVVLGTVFCCEDCLHLICNAIGSASLFFTFQLSLSGFLSTVSAHSSKAELRI
jgi:hypothetical protein